MESSKAGDTVTTAPTGPRDGVVDHQGRPDRQTQLARWALLATLALCAIRVLLLGQTALSAQFVMDEFVPSGFYGELRGDFYRGVDPVKTVLSVYFYGLADQWADSAATEMIVARALTLALVLGALGLVYGASRNLGRSVLESVFCLTLLLSFSNFLERSFRVRSDSLAFFLATAALFAATRRSQRSIHLALSGALAGLAFLSTQKAIYVCIALVLGAVAAPRSQGILSSTRMATAARRLLWLAAGASIVLLAYALFFGGLAFPKVLWMMFAGPVTGGVLEFDQYWQVGQYVRQTLTRNWLPYLLSAAGLTLALWHWRELEPPARLAWVFTFVITFLVFRHDQPWPYVFVMALPFLALWGVEAVRLLAAGDAQRSALVILVLVGLLALSLPRNFRYLARDNSLQISVINQAEALLDPGDRYCDGVRMVVTRSSACREWWDQRTIAKLKRSAREGDLSAIEATFANQPKLWILNYRVDAMARLLSPFLEHSYVRIHPALLLTGAALRPGEEVDFDNRWAGGYRLRDSSGAFLDSTFTLDGEVVRGEIALDVGPHVLKLDPLSEPAYLLPANANIGILTDQFGPSPGLFAGVYD